MLSLSQSHSELDGARGSLPEWLGASTVLGFSCRFIRDLHGDWGVGGNVMLYAAGIGIVSTEYVSDRQSMFVVNSVGRDKYILHILEIGGDPLMPRLIASHSLETASSVA